MPRLKISRDGAGEPVRRGNSRGRPSALKLMLRRQRRLLRPAMWGAAGFVAVLAGIVVMHSAAPGGHAGIRTGDSIASLRERVGRAVNLRVSDVVIAGRANTPEPLLRAALGVSRGDPILGFSVEAARARIESLSWVEHVAVERRLPGTIFVQLIERRPFAIWQNQGRFVLIDRDGQVVADQQVSPRDWGSFAALPLVVGAGAPSPAGGLLDALDAWPEIRARVVASVRVGERRWNLQMRSGMTVMLPEGAVPQALAKLAELQSGDDLLDRPLASVDLRLSDRLAIRPLPSIQAGPQPGASPAALSGQPGGSQATPAQSVSGAGGISPGAAASRPPA